MIGWPLPMLLQLLAIRLLPETRRCPRPEQSWGRSITEAKP